MNTHILFPGTPSGLSQRQQNKLAYHRRNGARVCLDPVARKPIVVLDAHGKFVTAPQPEAVK